jgi:ATP adenylyltransferase
MDHVLGNASKADFCIFEPPGTAHFDKQNLLLYRDRRGVVLLNRFPYANGHLLVAPLKHLGCLTELTDSENNDLMHLVSEATKILKKHMAPSGFNIGCNLGNVAGAGIADHLHFHIVPRWDGDHNFMTVLSDIRTIPEHIDTTFDKLLPDFTTLYRKNNP